MNSSPSTVPYTDLSELPPHPSVRLATQFSTLLNDNTVVSSSILKIWLDWVHHMDGFDPQVFWANPSTSKGQKPSIRPLAHQLFLKRASSLGAVILDVFKNDLVDKLGAADGADAFCSLIMLPGGKEGVEQNLFQAYWKKLLIPPPESVSTASWNHSFFVKSDELIILARIMDETDSATWTFRDEAQAHPGSGLVADLMNLVRLKSLNESDVAPLIARVRAVYGQPSQDPSQSSWLDLSADTAGCALAGALVLDNRRVDEIVRVGDRDFPAWEWLYYRNIQSSDSVVSMLMPLIEALPSDGSVQRVDMDPRFAPAAKPPSLESLLDETSSNKRSNTGSARLRLARAQIAAQIEGLRDVAREEHQRNVSFPGLNEEPTPLSNEQIDMSKMPGCPDLGISSILNRVAQMSARDNTFDSLTPTDNRASTGYIRRVLMTHGTDTKGRSAFMRLMRHRSDLLEKVDSAIESSPVHLAKSMREQLMEQITTPDLMGYTPLLWASASKSGSVVVERWLREENKPLVMGVEDIGLCSHWSKNSRWFLSTSNCYSYGLKSSTPARSIGAAQIFKVGGTALVFGPIQEQQRWARRLEEVLEDWAATASDVRVPTPTIANTPADVLWFMQAFVAVRGAAYAQAKVIEEEAVTKNSNGYRLSSSRNKDFSVINKETWDLCEGTLAPELAAAAQVFLAAAASNIELAMEVGLCTRNNQSSQNWTDGLMASRLPLWTNSIAMSVRTLGFIMSWRCASHLESVETLEDLDKKQPSSYNDKMSTGLDQSLRTCWTEAAEHYLLSKAAGLEDRVGPIPARAFRKL